MNRNRSWRCSPAEWRTQHRFEIAGIGIYSESRDRVGLRYGNVCICSRRSAAVTATATPCKPSQHEDGSQQTRSCVQYHQILPQFSEVNARLLWSLGRHPVSFPLNCAPLVDQPRRKSQIVLFVLKQSRMQIVDLKYAQGKAWRNVEVHASP